jgi:hypothetical protein
MAATSVSAVTPRWNGSESLSLLSNSPGNRRRVLLPLGLLMLSMAVFGWGLQYKLSLYQGKDSISHLTPVAKLLSQKERPAADGPVAARPAELPAFNASPVLLLVGVAGIASGVVALGARQAAARYLRTGSREKSRAAAPPCLQAIFLRPPPALS